ncbi:UPF0182 family protein [Desulfosarcina cetonica]|uniref:UPF0182 family protein n=1 Tax=Desulfosarcina cetonica TaxID=90730 RepID=UPI0006D12DA4|nr:UPF0182 family protein [Desulfosarcina cetonica]
MMQPRRQKITVLTVLAGILLLIALSVSGGTIQQWLWMNQVGYAVIFWRLLAVRWGLAALAFAVVLAATWLNLRIAARNIEKNLPLGKTSTRRRYFPRRGASPSCWDR